MAGYTKNSDGSYAVNYEDERFKEVTNEQAQKETQLNQTYDNILSNSDQHYQNQIQAAKDYANQQSELQQAQTDFAIQQIEQQKDKAQQDYTKEQKGAYVDYMKQTKSNAQSMANSGLSNTGYSESSVVAMYNQYQNRVGTAKESLNQTIMNYNNNIQQATLANNEKLAEIAFNALQTENQLNQQAFEYKNTVILQKQQELQQLNDIYYARYQDVLGQINSEIELQMTLDQIDREYEQWLAEFNEKKRQNDLAHQQWKTELELKKQQWDKEYALQERQVNSQIAYTNAQRSALEKENERKFTDADLSDNGEWLLKNLKLQNLKNVVIRKKAQDKIYYDEKFGRITEEEAEYICEQLGL